MRIRDIGLPEESAAYLESGGYDSLYPPQAECVRAGLLEGRSVLVSAPTASGKTLIATLAMLGHLAGGRRATLYLSPLRALATEKYAEFGGIASRHAGVRVGVSTGDYDSRDRRPGPGSITIMTNEKLDSTLRHDAGWAGEVGLIVVDEIHLLGDPYRGATLEMILSRFRQRGDVQIVGLSATISNAAEIAEWLGCALVRSRWRPVPLHEGEYVDGMVTMSDGSSFEVQQATGNPSVDLGLDSVARGGQALIFTRTRAISASMASKSAPAVSQGLGEEEAGRLEEASRDILARNENTRLVKRLAGLVRSGAAFHHAGLNSHCRSVVEEEFRGGRIKVLSSTPTLAAGVNLPARRVVISSVSRYDTNRRAPVPISVMEYRQLSGRAGRPQYDDHGEAIIVGQAGHDVAGRYIGMEPEPVMSRIADERSLRTHVLSRVAALPGVTGKDVAEFFSDTLGGRQLSRIAGSAPCEDGAPATGSGAIPDMVAGTLEYLEGNGLVEYDGRSYRATRFGRSASILYIDPKTATSFRESLEAAAPGRRHTLDFLYEITECDEFFPRQQMRRDDYDRAREVIAEYGEEENHSEYNFNRGIIALHYWISEATDRTISDHLKIESGDMHRMAETGSWLVQALRSLARLQRRADLAAELGTLHSRMVHGVREELAGLVRLRGVGRVRARSLFRRGIRSPGDLEGISAEELAGVDKIGRAVALEIKAQASSLRRGKG